MENKWKKSKAGNYYITRGNRYTVMPNKKTGQGFVLMVQGGDLPTGFVVVQEKDIVTAVESCTMYIKSYFEGNK